MQNNRRTPKNGSAMDGFVRRNPGAIKRRASLQTKHSNSGVRRSDGFVPRNPAAANQAVSFTDELQSSEGVGSDAIEITPEELGQQQLSQTGRLGAQEKKPHFWQFLKKRRIAKNKHEKSRRKKILKRIILLVVLLVALTGGFLGWKFLKATSKVFNGNVLGFFDSTKLKGEENGRVNILLAGTSEDDGPDHGGADLTDSIMVVSIDTKNNTGFTVSIPRDLWVTYGERCSAGYQGKINVAYQCGKDINFKEDGYAEGGMGLLQKIISTNLGIPLQYYGKINYTAFKEAVDAVGGITLTIDSEDPRGIYDPNIQPKDGGPVRLKNGPQQLDGKLALALARSRNAAGGYGMIRGDFDRTKYQRAMLIALKDKALSAGVISNPAKLGSLLDAAGDNVETDFKSNEVRRLYELSKLVGNDKVQSIDLTGPDVALMQSTLLPGPISIVRPTAGISDFSAVKLFFKKLTSTDSVVREGATVAVLNGSGTAGLAQKQADALSAKGVEVARIGNVAPLEKTVIVDLSDGKKPSTRSMLEKRYGVTSTKNAAKYPEVNGYQTDFVIMLSAQVEAASSN
jgi:LCP family protein required for cell wall assembly